MELGKRLVDLTKQEQELQVEKFMAIEKGLNSDDPASVLAATEAWADIERRKSGEFKTEFFDPNQGIAGQGFKFRQLSLAPHTLRKMARTPIISAIIGTRQAQISEFATPKRDDYSPSFVIQKKQEHYSYAKQKKDEGDPKIINHITDFIINCGDKSGSWEGDTFEAFLKKIVKDSLTMDAGCFEVVRNRKGTPTQFVAVDAATMYFADTNDDDWAKENKESHDRKDKLGYYPSYVQVVDSVIYNEYYPWDLCYGIRNSSTDIRLNGYGVSELEELMSVITWMLYTDQRNGSFFSNASTPKGMLKIGAGASRSKLAEFRQKWMSMVSGVENSFKMPIVEGDVEFINMDSSNKDMEFSEWQDYLIKVACAIFKIAPEEIGFDSGSVANNSSMFETSSENRLKYSKDKGLAPLLRSIEHWINKFIVNALHDEYEFKFVGLNSESQKDDIELDIQRMTNFATINEIREKHHMKKLKGDAGDIIMNPTFMQKLQMDQMSQVQEGEGEDDGGFDEASFWSSLGDEGSDEEVAKAMDDDFAKL